MKQGFTLIEIMVAVSIFAIVAVVTTGALVTVSDVNRKAQAIKIAMDNVSFAMDSMVLNLREGARFGCLTANDLITHPNPNNYFVPGTVENYLGKGCVAGQGIIFESKRTNSPHYIIYRFRASGAGLPGGIQIARSDACPGPNCNFVDITSSEVDISDFRFYVLSTSSLKPRATLVIEGQVPGKTPTKFNLQTTVKSNF